MAEEKIIFKVVADYDKAIKEWGELRDKVASTTKEYKECQIEINKLKLAKGELTGETFKTKESLQKEKEVLRQSNAEYKRRQKELNNTFKSQSKQEKSVKRLTNSQQKQSDATGSATAATMELSRVVSDAPYGIRGMANNITQLVSQLGSASKKAGGLGAALKLMGSQLLGPLGVVFAITAVVSALDYFYGANKKAEESTSDFKQEIEDLADLLGNNLNINIQNYINLLKDKKKIDEELLKTADKQKELEDKLNGFIKYRLSLEEKKRKSKLDTAVLDAQIKTIQEKEIEIQSKITKIYEEAATKVKEYNESKDELTEAEKGTVKQLEKQQSELKKHQKVVSKNRTEWLKWQKQIDETQEAIDTITKAGIILRPKVEALDLEGLAIGVKDVFKHKIDVTLAVRPVLPDDAMQKLKSQLEKYSEYAETTKKALSTIGDFIDGEFERELIIEKNKTNSLNNELNKRLQNENLSKDQRQAIQNQIAQNDEKLRVKQEKIARKQFMIQKAFKIGMALADTASSALKAYASQLSIPTPDAPARAALAAKVATGFGLAQVAMIARTKFQSSAGSSPRQAVDSSSSGGSSRSEPSFNIVGRSKDNLILSAIQSQFDKPLKAYVVARDVTNQQQLDGVISASAST